MNNGSVVASYRYARLPAGFPGMPVPSMNALFLLLDQVLLLLTWAFVIQAILSWLVAFQVINVQNRFVYTLGHFLDRLTKPLLRPIRRFLPAMGGVDISPLIVILLLWFFRNLLAEIALG